MLRIHIIILLLISFYYNSQAQDEFFTPGSTIGGYGELHYNKVLLQNGNHSETLDFHRFVLFFSHSWTEKLSFKSEVELEHNYVKSGQGELELEQAFVDYHFREWLGFQAGVILPSVGLVNEIHEPPTFLSVERPDYNNKIIPTTWFGNGVAIYGKYWDLDYKFTVMEGLDGDKISPANGIRDARQKGFKSNAKNLLYNFRLNYLGVDGQLIGGSFTLNKAFSTVKPVDVSMIEIHYKYQKDGVYLVLEGARINYSEILLKSSTGYYLDLGYNIFKFTQLDGEMIPFLRFSEYNTAREIKGNTDEEKKYDTKQIMFGVAYKPIPEIAIKLDYALNKIKLNNQTNRYLNFGIGYMF